MKTGVLLMAHGSPDSVDQMEAYLGNVMTQAEPTPELVKEMQGRYKLFGGRSPLLDITKLQAERLSLELNLPVAVGMRTWDPFIRDAVKAMDVERIIGLPLAPHNSAVSTGRYEKAFREAVGDRNSEFIHHWHEEPKFLEAWAELIDREDPVLFTAHSVPERAAEPYRSQVLETIDGIVELLGRTEWALAWQSRPAAPGKWLEPDVDTVLRERKWESVLIAPIGFVCDHAEVLYDIDHLHRKTADELGIKYRRTAMPNASPLLIEALASAVRGVL